MSRIAKEPHKLIRYQTQQVVKYESLPRMQVPELPLVGCKFIQVRTKKGVTQLLTVPDPSGPLQVPAKVGLAQLNAYDKRLRYSKSPRLNPSLGCIQEADYSGKKRSRSPSLSEKLVHSLPLYTRMQKIHSRDQAVCLRWPILDLVGGIEEESKVQMVSEESHQRYVQNENTN